MSGNTGAIRRADKADLPRLTEIYNQAVLTRRCTCDTETFSINERMRWFKEHQTDRFPIWVYETGGKVVGYAYISPYRAGRSAVQKVCEVSYYIDFGYHGRGIGSRLMAHTIEAARQKGFTHMVALLLSGNTGSITLLEKFGFALWGTMPDIARFEAATYSHLYYGRKL